MKRLDQLKKRLAAAIENASRDCLHGLPEWAKSGNLRSGKSIPVIICGTGHWAGAFLHYASNLEVLAVVDDYHVGKVVLGHPCLDTDGLVELVEARPEVICINTGQSDAGFSHFERFANERGWKMLNYLQAVRAFGITTDIRVADWLSAIVARYDEYLAIAPLLYDELSIETLYSALLYHLDTDREYLLASNRPGDATYFRSGFFDLNSTETYVDCGAYDGDSVQKFIQSVRGEFRSIHAFEPDPANFDRLQKWLGRQHRHPYADRITLHNKAVGSAATKVRFNQTSGEGACVPMTGADGKPLVGVAESIEVDCVTLDHAIREPISLLKLDVEGQELGILAGAVSHLRASKPRIAACAYHLPGDLIDLPRFIAGLDAGYRFGLRHHSNTRYDTVLYAF
jgi:FkbM family methyltransferase